MAIGRLFCFQCRVASANQRCDLAKKDRGIWMIGRTLETITGSKLPSNRQVLQHFFHLHKTKSKTISASVTATMTEIVQFWDKARIPVRKDCNIIAKIKKLHSTWIAVKKNASRRADTQKEKERQFIGSLDDLFDIAHAEALNIIQLPEDKDFLQAQRKKGDVVAWVQSTWCCLGRKREVEKGFWR